MSLQLPPNMPQPNNPKGQKPGKTPPTVITTPNAGMLLIRNRLSAQTVTNIRGDQLAFFEGALNFNYSWFDTTIGYNTFIDINEHSDQVNLSSADNQFLIPSLPTTVGLSGKTDFEVNFQISAPGNLNSVSQGKVPFSNCYTTGIMDFVYNVWNADGLGYYACEISLFSKFPDGSTDYVSHNLSVLGEPAVRGSKP